MLRRLFGVAQVPTTTPTLNTDELVEASASRAADLVVEKLRDLGVIHAIPMTKEAGIPKEDWEATVRSVINGQPGRGDQYRAYRVFMSFLETHDPIKQELVQFVQNGLKSSN